METVKQLYTTWTEPSSRLTAIRVSLVVGSILFVLNHGSAVLERRMTLDRWLAGIATYLVPYTVSIHGQSVTRSKQRIN
jgi:hypothetical protein